MQAKEISSTLTNRQRSQLRQLISKHFSLSELETLCFDLNIDFDDLAGERKTEKIVDLIQYVENRGRLDKLLGDLRRARLNVPWPQTEPFEIPLCPYKGLAAFGEEDANIFFGRQAITKQLVEKVKAAPFVAVIGPSGSGKSSLVFAGLVATLNQDTEWLILKMRPGDRPFRSMAAVLSHSLEPEMGERARLKEIKAFADDLESGELPLRDVYGRILEKETATKILFVVDQFEEIYTLCSDRERRESFIEQLLNPKHDDIHLVLTLRADFMGQALQYRPFADRLQDECLMLGPMSQDELKQVVFKPAENLGVQFEEGLVERILDDVGMDSGNLPLLEFALDKLWEWQTAAGVLTHVSYEQIGRVDGALTAYADDVIGNLSETEQETVPHIFVQMVQPGLGTEDTRRIASFQELGEANWNTVRRLATERLLVTNQDNSEQETAEVIHEALIQNWPQLKRWMTAEREFRTWQEKLRAARTQWEESGQKNDELLRGGMLEEAEKWMKLRPLAPHENAFISKSSTWKRRGDRLKVGAALAMLAFSILMAILAIQNSQQNRELLAKQAEDRSRYFASSSSTVAADDLSLALLLALEASNINTIETHQSFHRLDLFLLRSTELSTNGVAGEWNRDGNHILSYGRDSTVRVWDVASGEEVFHGTHEFGVERAIWNADGSQILSYAGDRTVRVWDVTSGEEVFRGTHNGGVRSAIWNEGESQILSYAGDDTVRVWDVASGEEVFRGTHDERVLGAAWNEDESQVLSFGDDDTIRVWDITSGEEVFRGSHDGDVWRAIWNNDGSQILSYSEDGAVRVWDVTSGEEVFRGTHDDGVTRAVWNNDGSQILSYSEDGAVRVWDVTSGEEVFRGTHDDSVTKAVWNADGSQILSFSWDGTVRVWDVTSGEEVFHGKHDSSVRGAVWNADESQILSFSWDDTVRIWNVASGDEMFRGTHNDGVRNAMWNGDESQILSYSEDGTVRVWDVASGEEMLRGTHENSIEGAAWNTDESQVLSYSLDGTVRVWSVDLDADVFRGMHDDEVWGAVWNRDESQILSFDEGGTVRLWDVSSGEEVFRGSHDGFGLVLDWNEDKNQILSIGADGTVRVWNVSLGEEVFRGTHDGGISGATWNADKSQILSYSNWDSTVRVWDMTSGDEVFRGTHDGAAKRAIWNEKGNQVLSYSEDGTVRVWDVASGEEVFRGTHENSVRSVIWNADESQILSYGWGDTVQVWDVASGDEVFRGTHESTVEGAIWNADESQILSYGWARTVQVWDVASGDEVFRGTHENGIEGAVWNADGRQILSYSDDGTVRVWDVASGKEVFRGKHNDGVRSAIWNADESQVLSYSNDGTVRVWDVTTSEEVFRGTHDDGVTRAVWNADESQILSYGWDRTVRVWDVNANEILILIEADGSRITSAQWNEDESQILVTTENGLVQSYYTNIEDWIDWGCAIVGRNFSLGEWQRYFGSEPYRQTCDEWPIHESVPESEQ